MVSHTEPTPISQQAPSTMKKATKADQPAAAAATAGPGGLSAVKNEDLKAALDVSSLT